MKRTIKCFVVAAFVIGFSIPSASQARLLGVSVMSTEHSCAHYGYVWTVKARRYGRTETRCTTPVLLGRQGVQLRDVRNQFDHSFSTREVLARNQARVSATTSLSCKSGEISLLLLKDKFRGLVDYLGVNANRPYTSHHMGLHRCR